MKVSSKSSPQSKPTETKTPTPQPYTYTESDLIVAKSRAYDAITKLDAVKQEVDNALKLVQIVAQTIANERKNGVDTQ